ncbi:MAG: NADH-quinone oxidoreductase subunit NuoK [Acidobacteriota bacterium]|nr:NADH-quinone oxidoreductase subunit NuoK [Acidobacteriota bacterium]
MISVEHYLALGFVLFAIGACGALLRRNPTLILMSIELMLTAVNVNLIAFSRMLGEVHGQLFSLFIMADAAAETALALGILVACTARPPSAGTAETEAGEMPPEEFIAEPVSSEAEAADPAERTVL